ncbi:MAG: carbohydrate binding domain-containing protein [Bryobacterales bacterium]|nr:carbohydrate binding domain-containing protein [Bryobacterales bacterium]
MALSFADDSGNDRVTVTVALGSLPSHTHTESQVTDLVSDLAARPTKGLGWTASRAAIINSSGELEGAVGNDGDVVLRNGGTVAKTADATASTVVSRDGSAGASFGYVAANNLWAYLESHFQSVECGAFQTVGGAFENMAKYSEDFSVATWDKNGGSCSVTANSTTAPDGNTTADTVTASTSTPIIQQQIAGLVSGGQYTFYVWAKVASGTKQVSIAIVDNAYAGYLAGPTSISLTTSWQRFKITGTLAGGQTGLWIVVRQYAGNGDNWTSGGIYFWGACLQQGNDPKKGYARTWGYQASPVAAGVACGPMLVVAKDSSESPFRVAGPGSNLSDHTLLQVTSGGELIIAGSTGNGYRLAEVMGATNPSGWSGVIKVKTPGGTTAGYILLYSNP